jgi:TRAP-type C4-dicarboxylate transport system permease small subunit
MTDLAVSVRPSLLRKLLDALYLGAGWLAGGFLVAIFLLMMGLSVGREIGVNIPAGDDFTAWCMAAMAFLGLAHTLKTGEMIRVGLLVDKITGRPRRWIELAALMLASVLITFFAWHAVQLTYDSYRFNERAQGVVPAPLWIPQLGYCLGLVLLAIAFVDELVHVICGNKPRYEKEPPKTAEEVIERAASSAV